MNQAPKLPLHHLFQQLRKNGFDLGTGQYMLASEAMLGGFGLKSKQDLLFLLKKIWLKPGDDEALFTRLFEASLAYEKTRTETLVDNDTPIANNPMNPDPIKKGSKDDDLPNPMQPNINSESVDVNQEGYLSLSVSHATETSDGAGSISQEISHIKRDFVFQEKYYPTSNRSIQQAWRFFTKEGAQITNNELDVAATITQISKQGFLAEPIYQKEKTNQTRVIVLIDHKGSMVPFKHLPDLLISELSAAGTMIEGIFYFHNVPGDRLFRNIQHTKAAKLSEVLGTKTDIDGVIVISDAGAARGGFSQERVDFTRVFFEKTRNLSSQLVWLNPMPAHRWHRNSASAIAQQVMMFEANGRGIRNAVKALKGKVKPIASMA